jgi:hypothetical protein
MSSKLRIVNQKTIEKSIRFARDIDGFVDVKIGQIGIVALPPTARLRMRRDQIGFQVVPL